MDFLEEVEMKLILPPEKKEQVMRELRSHYDEIKTELLASGMSGEEAEKEAQSRMGDPEKVVNRLKAVHRWWLDDKATLSDLLGYVLAAAAFGIFSVIYLSNRDIFGLIFASIAVEYIAVFMLKVSPKSVAATVINAMKNTLLSGAIIVCFLLKVWPSSEPWKVVLLKAVCFLPILSWLRAWRAIRKKLRCVDA